MMRRWVRKGSKDNNEAGADGNLLDRGLVGNGCDGSAVDKEGYKIWSGK